MRTHAHTHAHRSLAGYFFWMPLGGKCPYGLDTYQPLNPERDAAAAAAAAAQVGAAKDGAASASSAGAHARGSRTASVSALLSAAGVGLLYGTGMLLAVVLVVVRSPLTLARWLSGRKPESQALIGSGGGSSGGSGGSSSASSSVGFV